MACGTFPSLVFRVSFYRRASPRICISSNWKLLSRPLWLPELRTDRVSRRWKRVYVFPIFLVKMTAIPRWILKYLPPGHSEPEAGSVHFPLFDSANLPISPSLYSIFGAALSHLIVSVPSQQRGYLAAGDWKSILAARVIRVETPGFRWRHINVPSVSRYERSRRKATYFEMETVGPPGSELCPSAASGDNFFPAKIELFLHAW